MNKQYSLMDICNKMNEMLTSNTTESVLSIASSVVDKIDPITGIAINFAGELLKHYNVYKLNKLIEGLSLNLNIEKRLNELYNYVSASDEKAYIVANLFKKTINCENPKTCIIYGIILAKHLDNHSSFDHDELIVCKALENATDYDLSNFKIIMENYVEKNGRINIPNNNEVYNSTCDWCLFNRIFLSDAFDSNGDALILSKYYSITNSAKILLEYINGLRQTYNYK